MINMPNMEKETKGILFIDNIIEEIIFYCSKKSSKYFFIFLLFSCLKGKSLQKSIIIL